MAAKDKQKMVKVMVDVAKIGKLGGQAKAAAMTPEARSEWAKKAAAARWGTKAKKKAAK